jgi:hypothetical protein
MPDELWNASEALGAALEAAPELELLRLVAMSDAGVPPLNYRGDFGDWALVMYQTYMRSHPLLSGVRLVAYGILKLEQRPLGREWIDRACTLGRTFQTMIEVLRARLPGYPALRVPHLQQGSTRLLGHGIQIVGFPWDPEVRRMGLHRRAVPTFKQLGSAGATCRERLLALADCLERRPAWRRFAAAHEALSREDREALKALCKRFGTVLAEIDRAISQQPDHLLPAETVLYELVSSAEGAVSEYLAAFEAVDELISAIACHVQTVAILGAPPVVTPCRMDVGPGTDLRPTELATYDLARPCGPADVFYMRGPRPELSGLVYPRNLPGFWSQPAQLFRNSDGTDQPWRVQVSGKLAVGSG